MSLLGLIPAITGAVQTGVNAVSSYANYKQQQSNFDYQKAMQREAWAREDSATQRRVSDLKAAGLNPVLAAGNAAESSSPIHTEAPQIKAPDVKPVSQGVTDALSLMQMQADIARTAAETQKTKAEAEYLNNSNPIKLAMLQTEGRYYPTAERMRTETLGAQSLYWDERRQIENYKKHIMAKAYDKGLQITEAEAKNEALRLANAEREYNLGRWQSLGLPTNAGLGDSLTRTFAAGQGILSEFARKIFGGK